MNSVTSLVKTRPAETAGASIGVAAIAAAIATHDYLTLAAALGAFAPAAVTYLNTHGGLIGVVRGLLHGRQ